MAVKRRLTGYSGIRIDLPHLRSIESGVSYDFDSVLRNVITGLETPYVCTGFEITIPNAAINANSLQIEVSGSCILHSTASQSGTILVVPEGTAADTLNSSNTKVNGAFQNGVPNYVSLELVRVTDPSSADETSGWSESQKAQFNRVIPIGAILEYRYIINTSGFSTNLPLYIVGVSTTGSVEYITPCQNKLFRLGTGGTVPNPYYSYNFGGLDNAEFPANPRREWTNPHPSVNSNPTTAIPGDDPLAFRYGDNSITTLKDWMDAVMTRIKEMTASNYWYTTTATSNTPNTLDVWWDAAGSVLTGSGNLSYNLILETDAVSSGAYESVQTDPTILPGDSYVYGVTSGNTAILQSFNQYQLVINSIAKGSFVFDETLFNRRLWRPNLAQFQLDDTVVTATSTRNAVMARKPLGSGTPVAVASWAYAGSLITLTTSAAHGLEPGDYVYTTGLESTTNENCPNGVFLVKNVTSATVFEFSNNFEPTGTPSVIGTDYITKDTGPAHPYMPHFVPVSWSYVGSLITLNIGPHPFVTGDDIVVNGLVCTTNAPNGRFTSITVNPDTTISYTAPAVPTGTATVGTGSFVRYDEYTFTATLSGCAVDGYNLADVIFTCYDDANFSYVIGPDTLPALPAGNGPIQVDGIVAISAVANPSQVLSMVNSGSPNYDITVTTSTPHGYVTTPGPINFTIYGEPSLSTYIRTYVDVSLVYVSPTVFQIVRTASPDSTLIVPPPSSYINPGSDQTYARFPNNPYPGPVAWDSDILIKGIIGEKTFTIPATATATGTALANKFNTGGITGTAYLENGDVLFIELVRNQPVSDNTTYQTFNSYTIIGPVPPVDPAGAPLQAGDYVKFSDETENYWYKIAGTPGDPILTNTFSLVTDNNQNPTPDQRPTATGALVYCRGYYPVVTVKPHWEVPASTDVYWIGVRQDGGPGNSKVYVRGIELSVGETRNISDNSTTNLLIYTGANTEAAINPNYTFIDPTGDYSASEVLTVGSNINNVDYLTREISFASGPALGFQNNDRLTFVDGLNVLHTYTIDYPLTSLTVVIKEPITDVVPGQQITYLRTNYIIQNQDNLTLGIRKMNRESARVNTAISYPVYDESVYPVLIPVTGAGTIRSGTYVYTGSQVNPTAYAYVLNGTANVTETIENTPVSMPGGNFGATNILVHVYAGTFGTGSTLFQNGATTSMTVNNPGDPAFVSPEIPISTVLVLPPNRRTAIQSGSFIKFPDPCVFKASLEPAFSGEELLVITNDTVRQASVDYEETYGGPKGKITLLRAFAPKSRLRFRLLNAYGSAVTKLAGNVTMQLAYDGGRIVVTIPGAPVDFRAGDSITGGTALSLRGSLEINGTGNLGTVPGGIFGPRSPNTDQAFVIGNEANKPRDVWSGYEYLKTHTNYTGSAWSRKTWAATSAGAAPFAISGAGVTLGADQAARVSVSLVGRRSDGTLGGASFKLEGTFFYNPGTLVVEAAGDYQSNIFGTFGDGNTYAATLTISGGTDIVPVVFGTAGSTIEWAIGVDYQIISTST